MKFKAKKIRHDILLLISFSILTLSFYSNFFNSANDSFFKKHQRDSESLIIARLIESRQNGITSEGGFLGRYENKDYINYQYKSYFKQSNPPENFKTYTSSFGLQGYAYYIIEKFLTSIGISKPENRYNTLKLLTAAGLASLITLYIRFIYQNYGFFTATFTTVCITLSQWLVVFSNNLYWVFFLILPPFIATTVYTQNLQSRKIHLKRLYAIGYICLLIKSLAGYEYISTILISLIAPMLFFAIRDKWDPTLLGKRILALSIAGLLGFITAIIIHTSTLAYKSGSTTEAIESLKYIIAKRTHGDANKIEEVYRTSLESDVFDVFKFYWDGFAFDLSSIPGIDIKITFGSLVITLIIISAINLSLIIQTSWKVYNTRRHVALIATLLFSFLAPTSWYFLAKGHSYIHTHMNHVLWYVPFLLLGFSYIGHTITALYSKVKEEAIGRRLRPYNESR